MLFVAVLVCLFFRYSRDAGFLLLGYLLFMLSGGEIIEARLQERFAGDSMLAVVQVLSGATASAGASTFVVEPVSDERLPQRSRVSWYQPDVVPETGEIWQLELRLRRPRGLSNPGTFDRETWLFRERIHASGYVVAGQRNKRLAVAGPSPLVRYRREFVTKAHNASGTAGAVLSAVGVGARESIQREQWDRYARTGTSHLMAISGLHVGLAATLAFAAGALLAGVLRIPANPRACGAIAGGLFALAYAYLSGFGVPAQRAVLMLFGALVLLLWRRQSGALDVLAAAAIIVYVVNPLVLLAPGFSLSFAAVLVLLRVAASFRGGGKSWRSRQVRKLKGLVAMQWALLFGLMPLTILWFDRVAFAAPAVNLIVVPVFSIVAAPLTLLGMLTMPASDWLTLQLLKAAASSIDLIEAVIAWFASIDKLSAEITELRGGAGFLLLLPALWVLLPRGWPGRNLALVAVVAIVSYRPAPLPAGCFATDVLDVGQGLAVVVRSRSQTLLFDTGVRYRGGGSAAEQVVLPFLRSRSLANIDKLVVSHTDLDHAGGVTALLDAMPVHRIYAGESLEPVVDRAVPCETGQSWRTDGVDFRMLHPSGSAAGNNASCVLQVSAGDYRLLLTGDIESDAEAQLVASANLGTDVIVIPHHGSLTSSTPAFVNATTPKIAIASAGFGNRWGFPKTPVVSRWQGRGAEVYTTAASGALSFRICEKTGLSPIVEHRRASRRFWHDGLTH